MIQQASWIKKRTILEKIEWFLSYWRQIVNLKYNKSVITILTSYSYLGNMFIIISLIVKLKDLGRRRILSNWSDHRLVNGGQATNLHKVLHMKQQQLKSFLILPYLSPSCVYYLSFIAHSML